MSWESQLMSNILHFPVSCYWIKEDLRFEDNFVNDDEDSYDNDIKMNETCKWISDIVHNYLQITLKSGKYFYFFKFFYLL